MEQVIRNIVITPGMMMNSDNTWDDANADDNDKKDNMNTTIINTPHCTLGILLSAWQW